MVKWALLNIMLTFATGLVSMSSISRHKDEDLEPFEKKKVYLSKSIAIYIAIVACLVCLFSEQPIGTNLLLTDKWTIVLIFFLVGELLADYIVKKKCHPKDWKNH